MNAGDICRTAAELVEGERHLDYGEKSRNFQNIARLWNGYLGCIQHRLQNGITPRDVANMMELLKIARDTLGRPTTDGYIDRAGYAGIAGELAQLEPQEDNNAIKS